MFIKYDKENFFDKSFTLNVTGLELLMLCSDSGDTNGVNSKEHIERDFDIMLPSCGECSKIHMDMFTLMKDALAANGVCESAHDTIELDDGDPYEEDEEV